MGVLDRHLAVFASKKTTRAALREKSPLASVVKRLRIVMDSDGYWIAVMGG